MTEKEKRRKEWLLLGRLELQSASPVHKINEIVDHINRSKTTRILQCPHCGSDQWEYKAMSTLIDGSRGNYQIYTCLECNKNVTVKTNTDPRVYLGPEDEIMWDSKFWNKTIIKRKDRSE